MVCPAFLTCTQLDLYILALLLLLMEVFVCVCRAIGRERAVGLRVCQEPGAAAALAVNAAVGQPTRLEGQSPGAAQAHPEPTMSSLASGSRRSANNDKNKNLIATNSCRIETHHT